MIPFILPRKEPQIALGVIAVAGGNPGGIKLVGDAVQTVVLIAVGGAVGIGLVGRVAMTIVGPCGLVAVAVPEAAQLVHPVAPIGIANGIGRARSRTISTSACASPWTAC